MSLATGLAIALGASLWTVMVLALGAAAGRYGATSPPTPPTSAPDPQPTELIRELTPGDALAVSAEEWETGARGART